MKPNRCEKHQNFKYIRFCPFCKAVDDLEKERNRVSELLKFVGLVKLNTQFCTYHELNGDDILNCTTSCLLKQESIDVIKKHGVKQ